MNNPMHVEKYDFGRIQINGREYRNDVIVFPDRISTDWWRKEGHSLTMQDLEEVIQFGPDLLIVGRGYAGVLQIPQKTRDALRERRINLVDDLTGEAVELFNQKIAAGEKAVGAFHLTC